jgi:membrane-bound lytic murein transglycosylase D
VAKASRSDNYKVRNGDTITKISQRFGLDEGTLLTLNDIQNKHRIYAGQILKVTAHSDKKAEIKPAPTELSKTLSNETRLAALSKAIDDKQTIAKPLSSAVQENSSLNDPAAEEDTAPLGPTLPSELHPALSADPSDYTVAGDGTIEVQATETLGHFAHWLGIRTQVLRNINSLRYGNPVLVGKRLKLDFSKVSSTLFEQHRIAYHCEIQEAFFEDFKITDTHTHNVKRGESLWTLTHQKYHLPVWLVHQYNPDLDLYDVRPGMKLIIPRLTRRQESSSTKPTSPQQQKQPCDMPSTAADSPAVAL